MDDMSQQSRRLVAIREQDATVTIVLDGNEQYEVARDAMPASLPEVGGSVDSPLLAVIRSAAERKQVARRVWRLLDRRLRSAGAMKQRLHEEGFTAEAVDGVLAQFEERGLYSDRRFAEAFCRDTLARRPVGRHYLLAKLRGQRVAAQLARSVVQEYLPAERERELALAAAERRWRREHGEVNPRITARVVRFLVGRGFPGGLASQAAFATAPRSGDENTAGENSIDHREDEQR